MIFVGEAAARPANVGNMQFAQSSNHVVAEAVCVGNGRCLTHPYTSINPAAKMFGELAIDVAIDCWAGLIDTDCRRRFVLSARRSRSSEWYQKCQDRTEEK